MPQGPKYASSTTEMTNDKELKNEDQLSEHCHMESTDPNVHTTHNRPQELHDEYMDFRNEVKGLTESSQADRQRSSWYQVNIQSFGTNLQECLNNLKGGGGASSDQ